MLTTKVLSGNKVTLLLAILSIIVQKIEGEPRTESRSFISLDSFPGFDGFPFGDSDEKSPFGDSDEKNTGNFPHVGRHRGPIVCRRQDVNGNILDERECPGDYNCTEPADGIEIQIGGVVNVVFFCDIPYLTPKMSCKTLNNNSDIVTSRDCPGDQVCAGGPVVDADCYGNPITYYICVNTPTVDPQPNYAGILMNRTCCGSNPRKNNVNVAISHASATSVSSSSTGYSTGFSSSTGTSTRRLGQIGRRGSGRQDNGRRQRGGRRSGGSK